MTSPSPSERAGPPRGGRRCSSRRGRAFFQGGLRVSGRRIGVPLEKRHSPVPAAQYQCRALHVICPAAVEDYFIPRSEEHTSELQSLRHLVCRLLLEKKKKVNSNT